MAEKQHFAQVSDRIFVGNKLACGQLAVDICLHINRSDRPDKDCDRHRYPMNYHVDYRDGELLDPATLKTVRELIADLRHNPGHRLLVHCNAGGCRSPTIAAFIMAMLDREIEPLEAFGQVEKSILGQRGKLCNIVYHPKLQIVNLVREERGDPPLD